MRLSFALKMKIIVTTSTFPTHENDIVPRIVYDQIQGLKEFDRSLELYVLTPHHSHSSPMPDETRKESHTEIRYHYFPQQKFERLSGRGILPTLKKNPLLSILIPFFLWGQRRALIQLCNRIQPDLIYAHWFMPQAIVASSVSHKLDIPYIFTTHASDVSVLHKLPFSSILIARCLDSAKHFTAVSKRTAQKLKSTFSDEVWVSSYANKLSVIPMGTSYVETKASVNTHQPYKPMNFLGTPYVLFLGRLSEKKGIEFLLQGFKIFHDSDHSNLKLVIAGDGELAKELKETALNLQLTEHVIFQGFVSGNIKSMVLAQAEMVVIPSIIDSKGDSEGMPVVLMEALACSKRVIATAVSGAEEILTEMSGIIIEPENPTAIANSISTLYKQQSLERSSMERAAKETSLQFGWPNICDRHHQIFKEATK